MNESSINPRPYIGSGAWVLGILLVLLGIITISMSVATTFFTVVTIGVVLSIRGIFEAFYAFFHMHSERF